MESESVRRRAELDATTNERRLKPVWLKYCVRLRGLSMIVINGGRCFRSVDPSSDGYSKFVAVDEETQHEIMHRGRFGKTDRTTHEPLDPRPQIDVLAFDLLRMSFANRVLRGIEMTLIGAPSIGIEAGDVKRGQELL
jgi:hypothetical protein